MKMVRLFINWTSFFLYSTPSHLLVFFFVQENCLILNCWSFLHPVFFFFVGLKKSVYLNLVVFFFSLFSQRSKNKLWKISFSRYVWKTRKSFSRTRSVLFSLWNIPFSFSEEVPFSLRHFCSVGGVMFRRFYICKTK